MLQALRAVLTTASIRTATITLVVLGFAAAATYPYQSIVAIDQLGFSAQGLGLLLVASAVASTFGGVIIGHFSDESPDRKRAILACLGLSAASFAAFTLFQTPWTFFLVLIIGVPLSSSVFAQLFAVVRAETGALGAGPAASINSVVRSCFAASWIVVPGLVGILIAARGNPSEAYLVGLVALLFCLALYAVLGARGGQSEPPALGRMQGLREAFGLVFGARIFSRLSALALIGLGQPVNAALMPLIVTGPLGGTTRDIGLYAGLVAGLEVPFMIIGGMLVRRFAVWQVVIGGGVAHVIYLLAFSQTGSVGTIYLLAVINAVGAAILLSLHLSYLQEMLPDRPGLGTSLISIALLLARLMAAAVVAGVGLLFSTQAALLFAAVGVAVGCGLLFTMETRAARLA